MLLYLGAMRDGRSSSRAPDPGEPDVTALRPSGRGLAVPPPPRAPVATRVLVPGENVAGYELLDRVKSGGMGSLWIARRSGVGGFAKHVAIKVIHPHLGENEDFVRMFLDEARLTARIAHPNVIQVFDVGVDRGVYFMVMELVTGCSLADVWRVTNERKRRVQPELAIAIAREVAQGLHAAHELRGDSMQPLGVVHRDVSPDNVLLGVHGAVKLIDFGIAKASERLHETRQPTVKGKLRYLAPEQLGGVLDRRTDVFALGVVLWEMLTGLRLYDGASDAEILERVRVPQLIAASKLVPGLPVTVDRAIAALTAQDPAARPPTAARAAALLLEALPSAGGVGPVHIAQLSSAVSVGTTGIRETADVTWPPADLDPLTAPRTSSPAFTTGRLLAMSSPLPSKTAPTVSLATAGALALLIALVVGGIAWMLAASGTGPEIRASALPTAPSAMPAAIAATPPPASVAPVPVTSVASHAPIFPLPTPPASVSSAVVIDPLPTLAPEPTTTTTTTTRRSGGRSRRAPREHRAAVVDGTTLSSEL